MRLLLSVLERPNALFDRGRDFNRVSVVQRKREPMPIKFFTDGIPRMIRRDDYGDVLTVVSQEPIFSCTSYYATGWCR